MDPNQFTAEGFSVFSYNALAPGDTMGSCGHMLADARFA